MGSSVKPPPNSAGSAFPAILVDLFIAFGDILFGLVDALGFLALNFPTFIDMTLVRLVACWARSTGEINSLQPMSTRRMAFQMSKLHKRQEMVSILTAAPVADLIGRRLGLIACNIVFCFGVVLQTAATAIPIFVAGRFFAGYGVGMISATIPLSQSVQRSSSSGVVAALLAPSYGL